jgi:hypothetical protein
MTLKKKRNKSKFNWKVIQAEWESGLSSAEISRKKNRPTPALISRRAVQDNWQRDLEKIIRERVSERVSSISGRENLSERKNLIEKESKKRADIEIRHRDEPSLIRSMLYHGIKENENSDDIKQVKKSSDFLKATKLSMEIMKGIQEMERKSFRLDTADFGIVAFEKIERIIID